MQNEPDEIKGSYDHGFAAGRAESAAEIERLREALDALRALHALLDFEEPCSNDKPWLFDDWSGINIAFEKAYAAICLNQQNGRKE